MSNKEYILRKINSSEIINDPWRHIIIHDLMPQELYEGIKAETSAYLNSKHLRQAKKGFRAYHINVNRSQGVYPDRKLEPSLFEYYNLLSDNDIENAIKAKVNLETIMPMICLKICGLLLISSRLVLCMMKYIQITKQKYIR